MTNVKRRIFVLIIASLVIFIDQLTKTAALNILNDHANKYGFVTLGVVYNDGTAFGLGAHFLPFLLAAGAIAFGVVVFTVRSMNTKGILVALALVGGGALSNLLDRLFRSHHGSVVDFIDLRWWPTFNLADTAIVLGMGLFLWQSRQKHEVAESV